MSLQFLKASSDDAIAITAISEQAFDTDVEVGAVEAGGPPEYKSLAFHKKMAEANCLYKLVDDGKIVGGAIIFLQGDELNVGRIFVSPECFRKGYGIFIMQQVEKSFSAVKKFTLDTPVWNVRTNSFYQKLGYRETRRDEEFVYYEKVNEHGQGVFDMKDFIACCGLDCEKCEARIATINNDDKARAVVAKKWSEWNKVEIMPEMINCTGCRIAGVKTPFCGNICGIRKCAMSKNYKTCADCSEMESCKTLSMITKNNADALKNLRGI